MSGLDEVLAHYEQKEKEPLYPEQHKEMTAEAAQHLTNYLVGDGDVLHLYEYHECMGKIS